MADDLLATKVRALARECGRLADRYDVQASAEKGVPALQLRAWAQTYRNASVVLGLVIRPFLAAAPKLDSRRRKPRHD